MPDTLRYLRASNPTREDPKSPRTPVPPQQDSAWKQFLKLIGWE